MLHASRSNLIVYLENGHAVERGTHAELLAQNGRYARVFMSQRAQHATPAAS
jgi:ABC-type multidrug transport system fused ATPase/permease subunit